MNTVRVERRLIGSHRTRMDVRGLLVVASMIAVFACAFAAGRATTAGPVSHVEDTSSVPAAAAAGAVIPVRLSTAPPLQLAPPPPKPRPKPKPAVRHSVPAVSIRPVAPPEAAHAEAAQPEPAPATPAPAQPAAPVAREPAPTPAPAPTPTPTPTPAAKQPSAPSTGAPAGGGSFESSG